MKEKEAFELLEEMVKYHPINSKEMYKRLEAINVLLICYKNSISKDKIRQKIEETNSEKLNYSEDEYYLENEVKGYATNKLEELLEE